MPKALGQEGPGRGRDCVPGSVPAGGSQPGRRAVTVSEELWVRNPNCKGFSVEWASKNLNQESTAPSRSVG